MKFILTVLLVAMFYAGHSQSRNLYLRAGFNLSTFTSSGFSVTPGYHLGIGGERSLNENLSMLHELVFTQQGAYEDPINAVVRIHYLQFPLLLKLKIDDRSHFVAGPQLGIVIAGDIAKYDVPLTASIHPVDVSLVTGVGREISERWIIGLRLTGGLTDITRTSDTTARNVAVQISAALKLNKNE